MAIHASALLLAAIGAAGPGARGDLGASGASSVSAPAQRRFINTARETKYAAIGLCENTSLPAGVTLVVGEGKRTPAPLIVQDKIWEPRCDNGYPNVIHDPTEPLGAYRLWYGCFSSGTKFAAGQGSDRTNAWMYANSSDGIHWEKPSLGLYDLSTGIEAHNTHLPKATLDAFAKIKTNNNIVMGDSDGMGVTIDSHATDPSQKFKAFGTGTPPEGAGGHGVWSSADGLHWTAFKSLAWSKTTGGIQRYDDHQQPLWDAPSNQYVLTTRTYPGMRAVGLLRTPTWPPTGRETVDQVEIGDAAHQLYSQITFRWWDVWLGMVMVFDAEHASTVGTVHCRLSWSQDGKSNWQWVDKGGLTGAQFLPLGPAGSFDSHIIFAADAPVIEEQAQQIRVYYAGGNGPHNGARNTSIGMSTFRMDGLAGLKGTGTFTTRTLLCTGPILRISCDVQVSQLTGGSVRLGAPGVDGLTMADSKAIESDAQDNQVMFEGGKTFASQVGKNITLSIALKAATLWTVSFTDK